MRKIFNHIVLSGLAVFILLFPSCQNSGEKAGSSTKDSYRRFHIENYDSSFYKKDFELAWNNRDTLLIKTAIDSINTLRPDDVVYVAYNLSEVTGFGWTFVNIDDLRWLDTLARDKQDIVLSNISDGFKIYEASPMFMKKLPNALLMHRYFDSRVNEPVRLDSTTKFFVKNFLEDMAGNDFVVSDKAELKIQQNEIK